MLPRGFFLLLSSFALSTQASSNAYCPAGCASELAGYISTKYPKDLPGAKNFCSHRYPLPKVTVTHTAPRKTYTVTRGTVTQTTFVSTNTLTSTTTYSTKTDTTTDATETITYTATTTDTTTTETDTTTVTESATVTLQNSLKKRSAGKACAKRPTCAAEVWNYFYHNAGASSVCACLQTQKTVTVTVTPKTTKTVTAVSTVKETPSTTFFISVIVSTTVEATATESEGLTATETVTETESVTTTTTAIVASSTVAVPQCDNANPNTLGTGGCSSNCYCDTAYDNGSVNVGVCNNSIACGRRCNSGLDCPFGQSCIQDSSTGPCGGPTCVDTTGCSSSFTPAKRGLLVGSGAGLPKLERESRDVGPLLLNRTEAIDT